MSSNVLNPALISKIHRFPLKWGWQPLLLAIAIPVAALLLTLALRATILPTLTLFLFIPAVTLCAYVGGPWVAVIAAVWSLLLVQLTLSPNQTFSGDILIWYMMFFGVVLLTAWLQEQLKKSNANLAETSQQLNAILNAVADGITVQDKDEKFIFANAAATKLTGLSADRLVAIKPDEVRDSYKMYDKEGKPLSLEDMPFRVALRTGKRADLLINSKSPYVEHERWLDITSVPILGGDGKPQLVVNVFRDVTEAQESERQRKMLQDKIVEQALIIDKERRRFENILNTVPMMVWEGEGDPATGQTMIFVNRYGVEMLGYTLEEWQRDPGVGMEWVHPDDAEYVKKKTEENFHAATPIPFDFRFIAKDGRIVTVEARPTIVLDDAGTPIAARGVMVDVSERRRVEDELRRSNEELAQFAYIASHDLQEPLRMVTSYLQLIQDRYQDGLNAEANEFIGYAVDGANRMKALINDLLTHSRVQTNREKFTQVDLNEIGKRVLGNLDARIQETNATVTIEPLPTVRGSATMLTQLLQNLLSNALKFHGDAPPHIQVSVEKRRTEWVFAVRDNGIGIDPKYAERIFLIFQRLHSRAKYSGTGIGLAICKKVVERHQGRIWVESQKGEGATFYFTIPFIMS